MDDTLNTIRLGDCIAGMNELPVGSADLVFADPPFNIGYEYDVYDDRKRTPALHRLVAVIGFRPPSTARSNRDGTFWLAIGDEYAAELKLASQDVGFHSRSWVIWYYTFGVNCKSKFHSLPRAPVLLREGSGSSSRSAAMIWIIASLRRGNWSINDKRANPRGPPA